MSTPPPYPPREPGDSSSQGGTTPPPQGLPYAPPQTTQEEEPLFQEQRRNTPPSPPQLPQPQQWDHGQHQLYSQWQQQYPQPQYPQPTYGQPHACYAPPEAKKQSRCGIAGIILFILAFGTFLVAMAFTEPLSPGEDPFQQEMNPQTLLVGFVALGALVLNLAGLVVSLFGFAEKDKSKVTVWIGSILNGLPCLGCGGIFIIAFLIGFSAAL